MGEGSVSGVQDALCKKRRQKPVSLGGSRDRKGGTRGGFTVAVSL